MAGRVIKSELTAVRSAALSEAWQWIGTPYQHQASCKGAGTDCLGLVRGIWREIYEGAEPEAVPAYSPNWAEQIEEETLLDAATRWLSRIKRSATQPGDVLLFRMTRDAPCKHVAIMSAPGRMIHAYWGRSVCESHIVPYWQIRWAYSFSFPTTKSVSSL